jgi:hypothetical protein
MYCALPTSLIYEIVPSYSIFCFSNPLLRSYHSSKLHRHRRHRPIRYRSKSDIAPASFCKDDTPRRIRNKVHLKA